MNSTNELKSPACQVPAGRQRAIELTQGFTLVELLIVIGILAILSTTAVVIINPVQLLAQARDAKRTSNIDTLDKLITVYDSQGGSFTNAAANTVYLSLPSTADNCVGTPAYSLPSLPSPWVYACTTETNLRKTNGTGWIPLDFSTTPGLSVSALPVDPVNSDTNQLYYTFIKGSWNLTARLESDKAMKNIASKDKGVDPTRFESGSDKQLWTTASGLVGYWPLDEGAGTSVADSSGSGNPGTIVGSPISVAGKVGSALDFDGLDDYIQIDSPDLPTSNFTYMAWIIPTSGKDMHVFMASEFGGNEFIFKLVFTHKIGLWLNDVNYETTTAVGTATAGQWNHIAVTRSGSSVSTYLNGNFEVSFTNASVLNFGVCPLMIATDVDTGCNGALGNWADGAIDEVRVYNRALSASEISAMYNAIR